MDEISVVRAVSCDVSAPLVFVAFVGSFFFCWFPAWCLGFPGCVTVCPGVSRCVLLCHAVSTCVTVCLVV